MLGNGHEFGERRIGDPRGRRRADGTVPGDHPAVAQRVGAVHALPCVPAADTEDLLHDNAIESLNSRFRPTCRRRGLRPDELSALRCST
jgi:hypothetical protein